jgi:hypothetical protein
MKKNLSGRITRYRKSGARPKASPFKFPIYRLERSRWRGGRYAQHRIRRKRQRLPSSLVIENPRPFGIRLSPQLDAPRISDQR